MNISGKVGFGIALAITLIALITNKEAIRSAENSFSIVDRTEDTSSSLNDGYDTNKPPPPPQLPKHKDDQLKEIRSSEYKYIREMRDEIIQEFIKPWELQNAKYLPVQEDQVGKSLHILLPPLDESLKKTALAALNDRLREKFSLGKLEDIELYARRTFFEMIPYDSLYTIINVHLSDDQPAIPDDIHLTRIYSEDQIEIFASNYTIKEPTPEQLQLTENSSIENQRLAPYTFSIDEVEQRFGHLFRLYEENANNTDDK